MACGLRVHHEARIGAIFCTQSIDQVDDRIGAIEIASKEARSPTRGLIEGKFIASEFIGSRMVYFFHGPDGRLLEVEHHLSKSDPVDFKKGEQRLLTWSVGDVLTYDNEGQSITPAQAGMAA